MDFAIQTAISAGICNSPRRTTLPTLHAHMLIRRGALGRNVDSGMKTSTKPAPVN